MMRYTYDDDQLNATVNIISSSSDYHRMRYMETETEREKEDKCHKTTIAR
jgi:hypothetical protein